MQGKCGLELNGEILIAHAFGDSFDGSLHVAAVAEIDETIATEHPARSRANEGIRVLELGEDVLLEERLDLVFETRVTHYLLF